MNYGPLSQSTRCAERERVLGWNFNGTLSQIGADDQVEEQLAYPFATALAIDTAYIGRAQFDTCHCAQVLAEDDRPRAERNDENREQHRRKNDRQSLGKCSQREDRTQK